MIWLGTPPARRRGSRPSEKGSCQDHEDPTECAPAIAHRLGPTSKGRRVPGHPARSNTAGAPAASRADSVESGPVKIAVCVKEVPEAGAARRIDPQTLRLDRSGEAALNAFDVNAVEEALRVKEAQGEAEVVVVSLGPARALDSLRKALAMGADRAVLVADDGAAGSDLVATSRVLAKALEREQADLVLFGQQSSDSDGAVLWAAVADRLRLPLVSQAAELTVADGKATVKRQTEFGYDRIEAPLPAVVAVSDAINEPRYPSLKGIMGAKSKPQETIGLGDLGLSRSDVGDEGSRTEVLALGDPPPQGREPQDRGRRHGRAADPRLPRGEEADLDADTRLPRAPRGRAPEGVARRARQGGLAGRRRGRGRDRRRRRGRPRSGGRPSRRRQGLGRRRPGARGAAAAAAGRRPGEGRRGRAATTRCCSPLPCSPRTSPPGSPRGSTPG